MYFIKNKIKQFNKETHKANPDYFLMLLATILIAISIIASYSLSIYTVEYFNYEKTHFFERQLLVGIMSVFVMWFLSFINPDVFLDKVARYILFFIFLLIMCLMPFLPDSLVTASGGANRWIRLPGFSLSPVEFFKIGFIYFLAWSFSRRLINNPKNIGLKSELKLTAPYYVLFMFVVFLVAVLQKDLGQTFLLAVVMYFLFLFANRSIKLSIFLFLAAVGMVIVLILVAPHRLIRIFSWWSMVQDDILSKFPFLDPLMRINDLPEPYQVGHSLNAIHNGSFWGQGIGYGDIKMGFLSEVHTDFVLAGIFEEIGLVGIAVIILIYVIMLKRIFSIASRCENTIYYLFSIGIGLMIVIAVLINAYGISGLIPIKGIAVPFLSYGGSSMLASSLAIGFIISISRTIKGK